jgi:hypothetical protein
VRRARNRKTPIPGESLGDVGVLLPNTQTKYFPRSALG